MANTEGGCILFGFDDDGQPTELDCTDVLSCDPADITNKIYSFTRKHFASFRLAPILRDGLRFACLMIQPSRVPMVFESAGAYLSRSGKEKRAFSEGTLYFRHGAKSEPGTSDDLAAFVEREIATLREVWLGRLRQVVEAPLDSSLQVVPAEGVRLDESSEVAIRLTNNPSAPEYKLADPNLTHPNRQKEVLAKVNASLNGAFTVTPHHLQCVRRVHGIDANPVHCYHGNFASPTYSQTFIDWLIEQYRGELQFFENCKTEAKTAYVPIHDINDPVLLWLSEYMQKENLNASEVARKLKISEATISRLLSGKYKGNVPTMLARIATYREEIAPNGASNARF